jgi:hypothetical protein
MDAAGAPGFTVEVLAMQLITILNLHFHFE